MLMSHYNDFHFGSRTNPAENWCAAARARAPSPSCSTKDAGKKVDNPFTIKKHRQSTRREAQLDADYRLTSPPGPDGLSDDFLSQVRRAYVAASLRGDPPNKTIAADVHASPRSVERS